MTIHTKKIKVLHIITRLDVGGSSTNTIETVARLDKEKFETVLISGKTKDVQGNIFRTLESKGISFHFINELRRNIHPWFDVIAFFKIWRYIAKGRFDIVHTHSSKAGILGRWAAWLAGTKRIVHTPHGNIFYGYFNKPLTSVFIWIERITATFTDKIITLTNIGKKEHIRLKIAPPHKFTTIYSGIDLEIYSENQTIDQQLKDELNIQADDFVFGSVTRLDPIKGNDYLIQAMAQVVKKFPEVKLLLVGDGEQKEYLIDKCWELDISENVIFAGFRDHVEKYMQLMNVVILASLNEGMGRVILEAMGCHKPIIASRTGGIPELIEDGISGKLVTPKDINGLAGAMIELLTDRAHAKMLADNAAQRANKKFSLDKMVLDIDKLYLKLLRDK